MDKEVLKAKPIEIIIKEGLDIEIYNKNEGPWPFRKSDCLYCDGETTHYAYFNDGRNVVRRFCGSEPCKEKAISEVEKSVQEGSPINPAYAGINTRLR
jgi:hypothetical protein